MFFDLESYCTSLGDRYCMRYLYEVNNGTVLHTVVFSST